MSLYFKLKEQFYPNGKGITGFTPQFRLEGRARDANNSDALAMRIADPLWMLGRQWQFGEFIGEDNGSPISVDVAYKKEKVTHYSFDTNGETLDVHEKPIEALVEAVSTAIDLKTSVRIGQKFERFLKMHQEEIDKDTKDKYLYGKIEEDENLDKKSTRFRQLIKGKAINGEALITDIKKEIFPESEASKELEKWFDNFFVQPEKKPIESWHQEQLCHKFKLHTEDDNVKLVAPDYQSGHLDWYSFDKSTVGQIPSNPDNIVEKKNLIPINVSFPSIPDKRLFAFEDGKIDFSLMDVDSSDLLKMMLLDFALVSGSDWYTVPVEMELGELCWIDEIKVKDVFGVVTTIRNDTHKGTVLNGKELQTWDMFEIRKDKPKNYVAKDHFLFLAPAATSKLESEPLEEIQLLRDEYANFVWALEKKVTNEMGQGVDGFNYYHELYGSFNKENESDNNIIPQYKLMNSIPYNWFPFMPVRKENESNDITLKQASKLSETNIEAVSHLVTKDLNEIREEAIPRAGVRVLLTNQRIRWTNGKTYLWKGRKVLTGRGEGNSGLRFDYLK